MKVLHIAYYTILRNVRDYRNLTSMIALPIVLILILGSALSSSFKIKNGDPVEVLLINEYESKIAPAFENFLSSKDIKKIINIGKVKDFKEGIDRVKAGEAAALINVKREEIEVYNSNLSTFKASIVQNVVDSFIQSANAGYAYAKMGSKETHIDFAENIKEEAINIDGKIPRAIDYYAVSMLIMTMMYGCMHGCSTMAEEQFYKTEIRLKSAPIALYQIHIGKVAGTIAALILDGIIIILFTKYVYKADWGNNMPMILFACLTLAVMASGLGVASFMIIGNERKTRTMLSILVPLSTFLGGGYLPIKDMSVIIEKLSYASPNYITQKIMLNTIFDGNHLQTNNLLLTLWIVSFVLFLISAFLGRRDLA